jgi:hypothetical protein
MKKKLFLVFPKNEGGYWGKVRHGKADIVSLGLPTVAAITPPDWDVVIHDVRVIPLDYEQKVDLVGITGYTAEIESMYAIADEFRERGVPAILGGVHVGALPRKPSTMPMPLSSERRKKLGSRCSAIFQRVLCNRPTIQKNTAPWVK